MFYSEGNLLIQFPSCQRSLRHICYGHVVHGGRSHALGSRGATDPRDMEEHVKQLAIELKNDRVDSVVLLPV